MSKIRLTRNVFSAIELNELVRCLGGYDQAFKSHDGCFVKNLKKATRKFVCSVALLVIKVHHANDTQLLEAGLNPKFIQRNQQSEKSCDVTYITTCIFFIASSVVLSCRI